MKNTCVINIERRQKREREGKGEALECFEARRRRRKRGKEEANFLIATRRKRDETKRRST